MGTTKYKLTVETKKIVFNVQVTDKDEGELIVFEGSNIHDKWTSKICVTKADEIFAISCDSNGLVLSGLVDGKEVYSVFCNDKGEITYRMPDARYHGSNTKEEEKEESNTIIGYDRRLTLITIIKLLAKGITKHNLLSALKDARCGLDLPEEFIDRLEYLYNYVVLKQPNSINLTLDEGANIVIKHYEYKDIQEQTNRSLLEWDNWMEQERESLSKEEPIVLEDTLAQNPVLLDATTDLMAANIMSPFVKKTDVIKAIIKSACNGYLINKNVIQGLDIPFSIAFEVEKAALAFIHVSSDPSNIKEDDIIKCIIRHCITNVIPKNWNPMLIYQDPLITQEENESIREWYKWFTMAHNLLITTNSKEKETIKPNTST